MDGKRGSYEACFFYRLGQILGLDTGRNATVMERAFCIQDYRPGPVLGLDMEKAAQIVKQARSALL